MKFAAVVLLGLSLGSEAFAQEKTRLRWLGDFRLRTQSEKADGFDARWDEMIRLRFGVDAWIDPSLSAKIVWATGKSARSVSQTLGDSKEPGFVRRFVGLDSAYGEWRPVEALRVDLGRTPQLQVRPGESQVLFSEDVAMEGVGLVYEADLGADFSFRGATGSSWIRENYDAFYSSNLTDNKINWMQLALARKTKTADWKIGAGFYNFVGLQGQAFGDVSAGGAAFGNSEDPPGFFARRFLVRQLFAELFLPWKAWDLGPFAEALENGESSLDGKASWLGLAARGEKLSVRIGWAEVQADAVPAVFTDADLCGGTTDCRGLKFSSWWEFDRNLRLGLHVAESTLRLRTDRARYNRTQLDLSAFF